MYYNHTREKKKYLSDPIEKELAWVNDLPCEKRTWFCKLNEVIRVAYTYYLYHNYSIDELAELNGAYRTEVIEWILTAAYVIDGKYIRLTNDGFLVSDFRYNVNKRFPLKNKVPKCKDCVWAELKTGHRICFRDCDHYNCFQRRKSR